MWNLHVWIFWSLVCWVWFEWNTVLYGRSDLTSLKLVMGNEKGKSKVTDCWFAFSVAPWPTWEAASQAWTDKSSQAATQSLTRTKPRSRRRLVTCDLCIWFKSDLARWRNVLWCAQSQWHNDTVCFSKTCCNCCIGESGSSCFKLQSCQDTVPIDSDRSDIVDSRPNPLESRV